jgi:hypothetical protein
MQRIDAAWREIDKPASAGASLFTQVRAGYSQDTITRAKRHLQIRTETTNDPASGKLVYLWHFPEGWPAP